ncbi:Light-harvesting complex-like protein ohp1, chloroplastic [Stylosanthes scabra]|uniref:Light-harvesting complex-like protein ohp1, chloroplastic n=1 Tax=Stylosanthes scabra TaxID=79078 RepID=A0ABU6SJJ9_9FABA|nr:Light-harvesting complex-like protein ohp1, chloroplastic [Stylosanthes scabra]
MATSSTILPSSLFLGTTLSNKQPSFLPNGYNNSRLQKKRVPFTVTSAKPPAGVEFPKVQPQFQAPFLGFTRTAEIWNSRACMIGLIGVFIVEFVINKGILQVIGVDVGKGLDLPL